MSVKINVPEWGKRVRDLGFTSKLLELIILPTEKCNFRCVYCYESFKIGRMSDRTVNAIKKLIYLRSNDLELLKIDFFGGEPLLARDVIFSICEYASELSNHYGFHFQASATTNGYFLSPDLVRNLRRLGLSAYQVTLDGEKEVHDVWRVKANGAGSFDKIWDNLVSLHNSDIDFRVLIRIHIQPRTVSSVRRLLKKISAEFGGDERFVVAFKALAHLGGRNDNSYDVFDVNDKEFTKTLKELRNEFDRSVCFDLQSNELAPNVCYASRANSFVIRADGRIGKCTVALEDSRNVIGNLEEDGRLIINSKTMAPWIRGLWSLKKEELTCPLLNLPKRDVGRGGQAW